MRKLNIEQAEIGVVSPQHRIFLQNQIIKLQTRVLFFWLASSDRDFHIGVMHSAKPVLEMSKLYIQINC